MRSSSTSPASTFSARSRIDAALLPDSPTPRSSSIDSASTACGRGRAVEQRGEPAVDRGRGPPGELLVTDRSRELGEVRAWPAAHAAGRARRAPSARAATPDRASRARARRLRPSPETFAIARQSAAGTRARRRGRSRDATVSPTAGRVAIGHAYAQRHAARASTVELGAIARERAAVRPCPRTGPTGRAAPRRAAARPAPRPVPSTGAATGSTPHGVADAAGADRARRPRGRTRGTSAVHSSAGRRHTSAAAPACTTRPARITTIRSASANASS